MKYANATKISTQNVYNNELRVDSLHSTFDLALEASGQTPIIIEVSDNIRCGDYIDDNGNLFTSHKNSGNKNAQQGEEPKKSWIQIRCTQAEKALIVRNLRDSEKLSEFMLNLAINEANDRQSNR
ncbi:MAG: hypothetical protein ABNH21_06650 [Glaciecola sp.]|jgi:hypothetical protein